VRTDELDGLTVATGDWWFNLRPSNTEPLLRLNAEADDESAMAALRDEVLGIVRNEPAATGGQISPAATGGQMSREV
jgi:phosphomannomutase